MIVLHRLTVFLQTALIAGIFYIFMQGGSYFLAISLFLFAILVLLQGRLLGFDWKQRSFWIFFLTPLAFVLGAAFFFLFLEITMVKWLVALLVTIVSWMYLENLFTFYYLPGSYQPYSLEYLSLSMYLLFVFFFASGMYGAQIFLSLSFILPLVALFWIILFASICTFWVSKVNAETSFPYALVGAIGLSQLYIALGFLPTGFIANATALTVIYYVYLGLTRAHVLEELTVLVTRRYLGFAGLAIFLLFLTTSWT